MPSRRRMGQLYCFTSSYPPSMCPYQTFHPWISTEYLRLIWNEINNVNCPGATDELTFSYCYALTQEILKYIGKNCKVLEPTSSSEYIKEVTFLTHFELRKIWNLSRYHWNTTEALTNDTSLSNTLSKTWVLQFLTHPTADDRATQESRSSSATYCQGLTPSVTHLTKKCNAFIEPRGQSPFLQNLAIGSFPVS